jgi:hypothetical protein
MIRIDRCFTTAALALAAMLTLPQAAGAAGNPRVSAGEGTVRCESNGGREQFCAAPNAGGVRVVREISNAPCIAGQSFRYTREGVYVRNGCRADFAYRPVGGSGGGSWGGGPAQAFTVKCESNKHRWAECPVEIAGSVELQKQDSHAPCVRGWTWGTMGRDGIWVSDGCRGRFLVNGRQSNRPMRGGDGYAPPGVQRVQPR